MQKHERRALALVREDLARFGIEVRFETQGIRNAHGRLVLTGPKGSRKVQISSSPKDRDRAVTEVRRAAKRAAGEIV